MLTAFQEGESLCRRPGARPVLRFIPNSKQRLQRRPAERQAKTLLEAPRDRKEGTPCDVRHLQSVG